MTAVRARAGRIQAAGPRAGGDGSRVMKLRISHVAIPARYPCLPSSLAGGTCFNLFTGPARRREGLVPSRDMFSRAECRLVWRCK